MYRCLPSYMCVRWEVCADRRVSKRRTKTDSHLYRLQRGACPAHIVPASRSERETTVEGWKRKSKRRKGS